MRKLLGLFTFGFLFAVAPGFSQPFEAAISVGASRLTNNSLGTFAVAPGQTGSYSLEDGWRLGFRVTLNSMKWFGHEFGYGYNRTQLRFGQGGAFTDQGMAIHNGGYNFLAYATPEGSRIRPFATGGGHFNNYVPPGASAASGQGQTKFGFNYGAGLKVKVSPTFMLRFDFRQYQNGKPFDLGGTGRIRQNEISAGFGIAL